ncbi:MAG: inositol monophosphatase [Verrucomicrobiota bacterium]|nr:inositol monophosphatase [Verrucomicrobiota bacterium]
MKLFEQKISLASASRAARAAGKLMRQNLRATKTINQQSQHDIKLELDVRCQKLIERLLRVDFPAVAVFGEEGFSGDQEADARWVIDPIDGTVNFTYGIPHACVSIALQNKSKVQRSQSQVEYKTIVGVVYDPFCDELWTAIRGQPARLNGKIIRVSSRKKLDEAIVSIGFAKTRSNLEKALPYFNQLVPQVRKVRMMGAAALALTYVASGRFDAYVETGIRLWDIAAGGIIVECAGGEFWRREIDDQQTYQVIASNGLLRPQLEKF